MSTIQTQTSPRKHINVEKIMPPPVSPIPAISKVLKHKRSMKEAKSASMSVNGYIPYSPVTKDRMLLKDKLVSN